VLAVVYLVYTAGLTNPAEPGLCAEAIRLARALASLLPDEPEVAGLLALLLLTESRRASRLAPDGSLVQGQRQATGLRGRRPSLSGRLKNALRLTATAGSGRGETVSALLDEAGCFPVLVQHLERLRLDPADGGADHSTDGVGRADRGGPGHPEHAIRAVG
jgi:hypothetical protein